MSEKDRACWLALHRLSGLGSVKIRRAVDFFGTAVKAWESPARDWAHIKGIGKGKTRILESRLEVDPYDLLNDIKTRRIDFVTWDDADYPAFLRTIHDPPVCLFYLGRIKQLNEKPSIAIVGSRKASSTGLALAKSMAHDFARAGAVVVSGMARGIDTSAHIGALATEYSFVTAAVLACGVDIVYPPENRRLKDAIANRGVVLSEYFPGISPDPRKFPARNRIVSGISKAVVVAEAGSRSGALITAAMAAEQGRELFAVPRDPGSLGSMGCNGLLKDGASVAASATDVLEYIGLRDRPTSLKLSPEEREIVCHLRSSPKDLEDLMKATGKPVGELSATLLRLELKGAVFCLESQEYVAAV